MTMEGPGSDNNTHKPHRTQSLHKPHRTQSLHKPHRTQPLHKGCERCDRHDMSHGHRGWAHTYQHAYKYAEHSTCTSSMYQHA